MVRWIEGRNLYRREGARCEQGIRGFLSTRGEGARAPLTPGYGDPVRWWSRYSPERMALVDRKTGGRLTYAGLDREADRWRDCLSRLGVREGDRVAVLMGNRVEYVAIFF